MLTPDEQADVDFYLATNPKAGTVISGTGGWRKVRIARRGEGKSGGYRIVYILRLPTRVVLGAIYAKNERANISATDKAKLKQLAEALE
ncbi:MAG: type II toxin-antitoxin system RelE/ParE family toxin [Bacteroidota bacterium]